MGKKLEIAITVNGVEITKLEIDMILSARKNNNTLEVFSHENKYVKLAISKGIFRKCKLFCGPYFVSDLGLALTDFGKSIEIKT